jgi:hypothetical protein
MAAAVTPFPTELTTPPVKKIYLGVMLSPLKNKKGSGEGRFAATSPPF